MFKTRKMTVAILFALLMAAILATKLFREGSSGFGFGIAIEILFLIAVAFTYNQSMSARAARSLTAAFWSVGALDAILILTVR